MFWKKRHRTLAELFLACPGLGGEAEPELWAPLERARGDSARLLAPQPSSEIAADWGGGAGGWWRGRRERMILMLKLDALVTA